VKKVIFLIFALFGISAQAQYNNLDAQSFQLPTACDFIAREIAIAIIDGSKRRIPAERTDRYQLLRSNSQYKDFNIPRFLSVGKDLDMDGASYQDVRSAMRIECNKQSRGN
jgi:hypothetical protein